MRSTAQIINLQNSSTAGFNIRGGGGGNGKGGTCFGDSEASILYGSTDIIIGVNSFVKNLAWLEPVSPIGPIKLTRSIGSSRTL